MLSLVTKKIRNIESIGARSLALEMNHDFAKFIPLFKENDLAIFLFIALSTNEYGCASMQPHDIAARFTMSEEAVLEAFKRLGRLRLNTHRLIMIAYVNNNKNGIFQVVLPSDQELDGLKAKKITEIN